MADQTNTQPRRSPPAGFDELARRLLDAGLPISKPLELAMSGEAVVLSLDTRATWSAWPAERGYTEEQIELLSRTVGRLVTSNRYLEAMATDVAERHDVEGRPVAMESMTDRHAAALDLHRRAQPKDGRPKEAKPMDKPKPADPAASTDTASTAPPATAPTPRIGPNGRPILGLRLGVR
jgi:hypothetical protein